MQLIRKALKDSVDDRAPFQVFRILLCCCLPDMDALDAVLPVYVDYLGRFEYESGFLEGPQDVMKELLHRGVTDKRFLPEGELTISNGQLVLKDNAARVVAERFDLKKIRDPVAFTSKDQNPRQKSGYSRVVVFTEEKAGHFNGNDVFHAFQCLESSPEDLVEMVQSAIKQPNAYNHRNSIDSNWIVNGNDSIRSATVRRGSPSIIPQQQNGRGIPVSVPVIHPPLVTSDTERAIFLDKPRRMYENSDNPVDKYTILLNFCIEDVERFCADVKARMQQQQPRGSEVQANDFVRIFQKFKLAFNLLAYLQGQIHEPDAIELLHHLFPPLAYLVDECYELFDEDLVRDVVSPLPTRKAVRMLSQHLTDREQVIWKALGDYWRQPRSNWDGDIPSYKPIFHGGWSPGVIILPDDDDIPDVALRRVGSDRSKKTPSVSSADDVMLRHSSGGKHDSFDTYRDELMAKKARIALVTFARERQNSRELTVVKGEYLQVLDDDRKWWKCKNGEGEVGFVPNTLLKAILYTDSFDDIEDRRKYEHVKRSGSSAKGRKGRRSSTSSDDSDAKMKSKPRPPSPAPSIPPPAPPMPINKPKPLPPVEKKPAYNSSVRSTASMQEELKNVLDIYRDRQEKLNIMTTPQVYIMQTSTPHEVRKWLIAKQFSQRVIDQMAGMHGGNLFAMTRKDLIAAFGKTEGKRLDSQITISRNTTGFKTVRSSELKDILEKARKRTEKANEEKDEDSDQEEQDHSRA